MARLRGLGFRDLASGSSALRWPVE
uniref:Uncharacterized protein n=1 Tax=Arundo donax TaxID=35708 RepID=A0A0A9EGN7_ARUDO